MSVKKWIINFFIYYERNDKENLANSSQCTRLDRRITCNWILLITSIETLALPNILSSGRVNIVVATHSYGGKCKLNFMESKSDWENKIFILFLQPINLTSEVKIRNEINELVFCARTISNQEQEINSNSQETFYAVRYHKITLLRKLT